MITTRKTRVWINEDDTKGSIRNNKSSEAEHHSIKEIYYGKIQKISSDNDISYVNRGSVFFLRDNLKDPNTTYHPYLVIQSSYLDKIGRIAVLGITSVPSSINMVPIVMKDSIGYIDPHQPYTYKIDEFYESGTRFVGSIVNTKALDIAVNLYGLHLGMALNKSEDEIISDYLNYVEEFKERTKHLKPYKHKVLEENNLGNLELQVSFNTDNKISDICWPENFDEDIDGILDMLSDNDDDESYISDSIDMSVNDNGKPMIEIDTNSQAILSTISTLEDTPAGIVKLPRHITDMTEDEIIILMASIKINGIGTTSLIYNCSDTTISNKKKQISEKYNVIYK